MMITLDEIIPYQPPLPPKPCISSKTIPPPSKLPPLIHPLPQKPQSRHQSPSCPSQLHQSKCDHIPSPIDQEQMSGVPLYTNVFDRELAAWSDMAIKTTAFVSTATENTEQQQHHIGSDLFENGPRKLLSGDQSDNVQHASHDDEASPSISAGFLGHDRSCSAHQETTQLIHASESNGIHATLSKPPVRPSRNLPPRVRSSESRSGNVIPDTAHLDNMDSPHASSGTINPAESPNSIVPDHSMPVLPGSYK
ncbi:hypothetical protein TSTA_054700, partial [Talaromyces stipitatus ATCC 10500]